MRTTKRYRTMSLRRLGAYAADESGVLMMFVLMAILIVGAVTLTVIQLISADVAGGLRELQADQVANIAQAGAHYGIGKLQLSGAASYGGETITITSGSTTLGTAVITVNCIDTGAAPPCTGAYAAYRRIISNGSLPVPGPSRTIVAVVQATSGAGYGLCAFNNINPVGQGSTITGDVGSNGAITVSQGVTITGNVGSGNNVTLQGNSGSPDAVHGSVKANGTISPNPCTAPGCNVSGGTTPSAGLGTVCPSVTLGTATPGTTDLSVPVGTTFTLDGSPGHGYSWRNITLNQGGSPPCSGGTYTNLVIQTGAAGTTMVVQISTLTMQQCTRFIISGSGNADLRVGGSGGNALQVQQSSLFGVTSSNAAVPAGQLMVEVPSSSVTIQQANLVSGYFLVPTGQFTEQTSGSMNGAVVANTLSLQGNYTFTYDASVGNGYSNFSNLRSWKDQ